MRTATSATRLKIAWRRSMTSIPSPSHGLWTTVPAADGSDVERTYSEQSAFLVVYTTMATPDWVSRCVESRILQVSTGTGRGLPFRDDRWEGVLRRGEEEGFAASRYVAHELRRLVASDVRSSITPLTIVRSAIRYPTQVLREAGITTVQPTPLTRTDAQIDDPYGLSPATLAALHPLLPEVAWRWEASRTAVLEERAQRYPRNRRPLS